MPNNPTTRFCNRVTDYLKFRPRYPEGVVKTLRSTCGLSSAAKIADIGSGTGFLSELFLENGNPVWGVEPNREMREAGESALANYAAFKSLDGTAEQTGLPDDSMDFVVAGQAFHWFDRNLCRPEFERILQPGGYVVLIWNERRVDTPFLAEYENLVQEYGTDYSASRHRAISLQQIESFLGHGSVRVWSFPNEQRFDFAGLRGRLLSSSYIPNEGHATHHAMLSDLQELFGRFAAHNQVAFLYVTKMYVGQFLKS